MRINLRKALALMISLLMLCTLIPMGAMTSVSAADPVVSFDLNFNDGSVGGFSGGSNIAGGGPDGSNCFKWTATGGWSAIWKSASNVYENGTYVISFKAKASVAGEMSITIQDGGWADYYYKELFNTTTEWTDYEIITNVSDYPTSNGGILFKFQDQGTAMDLYIDDLKMYEYVEPEPETPTTGNNLVVNGDFEDGKNGWSMNSTASVVSGGYTGSAIQLNNPSAWSEAARQDIAVEAFETYTLTWRSKRVSGSGVFNMEIAKAPYDGTKPQVTHVTNYTWMNDTSGNWVDHKVTIEMKDSNGNGITGIMIKLTTEATNPGVILLDDICLTKNLTASFDGYIYNGDFEVGSLDKWTAYNGTAASTAAKHSGAYGAYLESNGSWGGVMSQATVNVVANKTYIVSYYIKVTQNAMCIQIKDGTTSSGSVLASKTHNTSSDWALITFEVKPTQNGLYINFHGSGSADADPNNIGKAYVDDLKIELKGGNPQEKVEYTGSSVRDNDPKDESSSGKGLAFQFKVSTEGGTRGFDNKYVEKSGKIVLGDDKYELVRMGAVMTNNATVGQNANSFNLSAVDKKKVIDIPAVYLNGADAESLSFAVRICDIPDKHIGTTVYARPYYVYLENGVEVTIYGDTRANNYAKAANISTADKTKPIKILSIGHSFSKDVMTTNLYNMFKEGGYEDVTIGYLYMAGCSMPKHLYNIQNNLAQYEYSKNNSGTWVTKYNVAALTALKEEEWDFVTVQSSPDYIGGQSISNFSLGINNDGDKITLSSPQTEYEAMDQITDWIKANATNANVKIDYHMIWSFSQGCDLWSGMYHKDPNTNKYSQIVMYNNIVNITQDKVQNHEDINRVIPSATAIQNVRSSFMGDNFNMPDATQGGSDGYHLNDYGDYVAALTWYCHYSGDNATIMAGYTSNEKVSLTNEEFLAIAEAVNKAIDVPYAVSESTHK